MKNSRFYLGLMGAFFLFSNKVFSGALDKAEGQTSINKLLVSCVPITDRFLLSLNADIYLLGEISKGEEIRKKTEEFRYCLNETLKHAVEEAGTHEDLKEAIKSFYIKELSLVNAILPDLRESKSLYKAKIRSLERERDEAFSKANMELKLVGME